VNGTNRYAHNNLSNVYLLNGFFIEEDPDLGECVVIEAINDLNDRLSQIMIVQAPYLNGAQLQWLRSEMGLERATLASRMNVSAGFIELAERASERPLPFFFDQAFRSFCCEYMGFSGYAGSWTIQSSPSEPYSIQLAIENGRWVGILSA
jgi:DNA-binding transcriptional regulator YiaG